MEFFFVAITHNHLAEPLRTVRGTWSSVESSLRTAALDHPATVCDFQRKRVENYGSLNLSSSTSLHLLFFLLLSHHQVFLSLMTSVTQVKDHASTTCQDLWMIENLSPFWKAAYHFNLF